MSYEIIHAKQLIWQKCKPAIGNPEKAKSGAN
jgi:hypothetical protein